MESSEVQAQPSSLHALLGSALPKPGGPRVMGTALGERAGLRAKGVTSLCDVHGVGWGMALAGQPGSRLLRTPSLEGRGRGGLGPAARQGPGVVPSGCADPGG